MFRRVVTLLLIPSFLLLQAMSQGHSHGRGEPPGHDGLSHIHFGDWLFAHHADCHHDDDEGDRPQLPIDDHDDDALYVSPSFGGLVQDRLTADDGSAQLCSLAPPWNSTAVEPIRILHLLTHGPPSSFFVPIYLRTLSLLL